jgi:hypothetical protein
MESFSVRCIFKWSPIAGQTLKNLYEERITLWHADSLEQAIEFAESEAAEYADESCEFLGLSQAYAIFELIQANGIEVFSLLRESDLEPEDYLNSFFDSGLERQSSVCNHLVDT